MLIPSARHTGADLRHWDRLEALDVRRGGYVEERLVPAACARIGRFLAGGSAWVGVSWGKDSTVVADLVRRVSPETPLVWIRVDPIENPDCARVRDLFLARWGNEVNYHELVYTIEIDAAPWEAAPSAPDKHPRGTGGFRDADGLFGARTITGLRRDESARREFLLSKALVGSRYCAPIGGWSGIDVFAYLAHHELPVHPAYACTFGGTLERERVRVGQIGGARGTGRGRQDWESHYYGDALSRVWGNRR